MIKHTVIALSTAFIALVAGPAASAGGVSEQFGGGAFGVPWNAPRGAVESHYPGGKWLKDEKGRDNYCVVSTQTLLHLPPPHQTRELCFLLNASSQVSGVMARMDASLPTLLAVVNRSRTTFGDFDAVRRDEGEIISHSTKMLWTRDAPYVVQVASRNDDNGSPVEVSFTVSEESSFAAGAAKVSNAPPPGRR
ncbi:MAG TPA: hypothetical protein VMT50_07175 [Steroidobacteraceae bacterium]|nr:hypothetical protein [Steroidobacteraceae bacterium]